MNLEEYEKILEDHGHKYIYYPKDIIQIKLREELIEKLTKDRKDKKEIEKIINICFREYD